MCLVDGIYSCWVLFLHPENDCLLPADVFQIPWTVSTDRGCILFLECSLIPFDVKDFRNNLNYFGICLVSGVCLPLCEACMVTLDLVWGSLWISAYARIVGLGGGDAWWRLFEAYLSLVVVQPAPLQKVPLNSSEAKSEDVETREQKASGVAECFASPVRRTRGTVRRLMGQAESGRLMQ